MWTIWTSVFVRIVRICRVVALTNAHSTYPILILVFIVFSGDAGAIGSSLARPSLPITLVSFALGGVYLPVIALSAFCDRSMDVSENLIETQIVTDRAPPRSVLWLLPIPLETLFNRRVYLFERHPLVRAPIDRKSDEQRVRVRRPRSRLGIWQGPKVDGFAYLEVELETKIFSGI